MAATATQQVINNGPRNLVVKYTIAGATGDTTAGVLLDIDQIETDSINLRLERAQWSLTGHSCKLLWDGGTADVDLLELSAGEGSVDYSLIGGIANNADDASGDVLFTTTGYTASGDGGSFILEFKKRASLSPSGHYDWVGGPGLASLGFTGGAVTIAVA